MKAGNPKTRKPVLGSSCGEDGLCSSETKHNRKTAPRRELFISGCRLQKQRGKHEKLSWVRVTVKMVSVTRTKNSRKRRQDKRCLLRLGYYRNRGHNYKKLSLVRVSMKVLYVASKVSTVKEHREDQSTCFARKITGNRTTTPKICSWSESR
jgi:hypothetical protein